ncbi:hypothetical protein B0H17DRAFT_1055640 [Mycena rosella]|uniref:Uncharacterized protein n=1 Tax=Mycena rosella TaxID=1033263 RepID=A0AAD7DNF7_MYCRO|nr:hypothetical protein B0H17DRAFT_1055640 [Mycena rosella]
MRVSLRVLTPRTWAGLIGLFYVTLGSDEAFLFTFSTVSQLEMPYDDVKSCEYADRLSEARVRHGVRRIQLRRDAGHRTRKSDVVGPIR